MPVKRVSPIITAIIILALIQLACSTSSITQKATEIVGVVIETAAVLPGEATQPPAAEVPIVAGPPTATPFVYSGAPPQAGTGGVYGRLFWNGKPVQGQEIKLCDEIKTFGGCQGAEYSSVTDANGVYAILNVPPGSYGLTYRAMDSDTWYYITSGILDAKDFEVPADQMINVGDFHTIRTDLVILTPTEDERMSGVARPVLS